MRATELLVDGLDHPEGVVLGSRRRRRSGRAARRGSCTASTSRRARGEEAAARPGFVLGLAVDAQGRLAMCCGDDGLLCVR